MSSAQPPRQSQAQPAQKPRQARGKRGKKNDSNSQPGSSYVPVSSSSSSSSSSSASPVQIPAYGAEPEIDLVGVDGRIFRKQKVNSFKRTGGSSVNAYRRPVGVSETPTKIPMLDDEPDCKASAFAEKIASSFAKLDVQEDAAKQAPAEKRSAVERTLKKIEIEGKDPDWKWTVSLLPDISKKIQSPSLSESFRLMTNQNSSCVFSFPPSKSPAISTFQINGPSLSAVEKARISAIRLIETVVDSIGFTHYLSVEFDEIGGPFKDFAGLVPNSEVVGKYVSKLEHLHVTLFLMKLFTPDQVKEATALFRSLSPNLYDLADTMSVWVNIHNLCTFSEDITKTRVLYFDIAEANASSPLKRIREFLCNEFERADYPGNFRDPYTPHLTALNCKFSDGKPFDATEILSQFAGFSLGKFRVKQIKLLARNPTKLLAQTNLP